MATTRPGHAAIRAGSRERLRGHDHRLAEPPARDRPTAVAGDQPGRPGGPAGRHHHQGASQSSRPEGSTSSAQPVAARPATAGILQGIVGSILLMVFVVILALPLGVGGRGLSRGVRAGHLAAPAHPDQYPNLAGIPAIVYGLLGLGVFVSRWGSGETSGRRPDHGGPDPADRRDRRQEALRAVLAGTRGRLRARCDPLAGGPGPCPARGGDAGILTGIILSISRAIGETTPCSWLARRRM